MSHFLSGSDSGSPGVSDGKADADVWGGSGVESNVERCGRDSGIYTAGLPIDSSSGVEARGA
jgi:hypothetical protein